MSEEGQRFANRDYFGYVEMDDFACYVLADSLDSDTSENSAKLVVESLIRSFTERPSMSKGAIRKYILHAHEELKRKKGGMHLKAALAVAVTDYKKLRYGYVGNSRMYLLRNSRILIRTKDQSLTENLLEDQKVTPDKARLHEERNNLYSYLGGRERPKAVISGRIALMDGDIVELMSRGLWEQLDEQTLVKLSDEAKEPKDVLAAAEDLILSKQEETQVDNYTLAVTFIDKIYRNPKKRISVKQVLMIVIPTVLLIGGISLGIYLRYRSIEKKKAALTDAMENGETYLQYDNFEKAAQEYDNAVSLAKSLKKKEEEQDADEYRKLAQQIMLGDAAMAGKEYQKAQELYLTALDMSLAAGNVGKTYLDGRLAETKNHMEVFDLIDQGIEKEDAGNLTGAIECYKQARALAADVYDSEGRAAAMEKQAAAEKKRDELEAVALAQEEKAAAEAKQAADTAAQAQQAQQALMDQQKANEQKAAIDLENQGNEMLAQGQFESAETFFKTAQAMYTKLELPELAAGLNQKIEAARAGKAAADAAAAQAAAEAAAAQQRAAQEAQARAAAEAAAKAAETKPQDAGVMSFHAS